MAISEKAAGRRAFVQAAALVLAALAAAVLLAVAVPALQEVRATTVCSRLGGQVQEATETVEPLVRVRTVYRCHGPGGTILGTW